MRYFKRELHEYLMNHGETIKLLGLEIEHFIPDELGILVK